MPAGRRQQSPVRSVQTIWAEWIRGMLAGLKTNHQITRHFSLITGNPAAFHACQLPSTL